MPDPPPPHTTTPAPNPILAPERSFPASWHLLPFKAPGPWRALFGLRPLAPDVRPRPTKHVWKRVFQRFKTHMETHFCSVFLGVYVWKRIFQVWKHTFPPFSGVSARVEGACGRVFRRFWRFSTHGNTNYTCGHAFSSVSSVSARMETQIARIETHFPAFPAFQHVLKRKLHVCQERPGAATAASSGCRTYGNRCARPAFPHVWNAVQIENISEIFENISEIFEHILKYFEIF